MTLEVLLGVPGRLDAVLAGLSGRTRADVQRAIRAGLVTVDGVTRPKSFHLSGGERIEAEIGADPPLAPEGPPVPVRYRDEDLLVVAKPAGLLTHPTPGRRSGTLVNRLLGMDVQLSTMGGALRPGIVHRLDIGTSGLMIVAETDRAYEALTAMFREHAVSRTYLALVRGQLADDDFSVDAPLGRAGAKIVVDRAEGRPARTAFSVLERLEGSTLVSAAPRTGRTHQIRVHLRAVAHPILGDGAYGGGGDEAQALGLTRPFLHSWRLAFDHPFGGLRVELEEPLPDDLDRALARVRGRAPGGSAGKAEADADAPDLGP
jgi:23S rRNA pseudouridine1911/1915/1917 synthase